MTPLTITITLSLACNILLAVWMLIHTRQFEKTKKEHEEFMALLNQAVNTAFDDIGALETDVARLEARNLQDRDDIKKLVRGYGYHAERLLNSKSAFIALESRLRQCELAHNRLEAELANNGAIERA